MVHCVLFLKFSILINAITKTNRLTDHLMPSGKFLAVFVHYFMCLFPNSLEHSTCISGEILFIYKHDPMCKAI